MKAFVIGGAGFIGSHIVDELLEQNYEVIVIDNLSRGNKQWVPNTATFYELDILYDDLSSVFATELPDYVFHMAAQISVANSMASPGEDARMNILGTINVLQCAVDYQVKRFVFASSVAVYGIPDTLPLTEEHVLKPRSFYGISKASSEAYIKLFGELHQLNYSIFRFANVYGPRQNSHGEAGVIAVFADKILTGSSLFITGNGLQTRDFIYVKDIALACIQSLPLKQSMIINLGTNQHTSINALADIMMDVTGIHVMTKRVPANEGDISHSCVNNHLAKRTLEWQPMTSLRYGLRQTFVHLTLSQKIEHSKA